MFVIQYDSLHSEAKRGSGWLQLPEQKRLYKKTESSIAMDSGGRASFFLTSRCTSNILYLWRSLYTNRYHNNNKRKPRAHFISLATSVYQ